MFPLCPYHDSARCVRGTVGDELLAAHDAAIARLDARTAALFGEDLEFGERYRTMLSVVAAGVTQRRTPAVLRSRSGVSILGSRTSSLSSRRWHGTAVGAPPSARALDARFS